MLSTSEALIRDIVRLDASAPFALDVANLPSVTEELASALILNPSQDLTDIACRTFGTVNPVKEVASRDVVPRPTGTPSGKSLGWTLARAHRKRLGSSTVQSQRGTTARREIMVELSRLGLVERTTLPLSVGLFRSLRKYVDSTGTSSQPGELAQLIDRALPEVVEVARHMQVVGLRLAADWRSRVSARDGTVASIVLTKLYQWPVVDSATLIAASGANKSNVYRALDLMIEVGVICEVSGRAKNRIWVAPDVVRAVEEVIGR